MTLVAGAIGAGLVLVFVVLYNSLVQRKNAVETCWGAIDAYLKKRFDLVPNLVGAVQQYMQHEKDTFEKLVQLRERSMGGNLDPQAAADMDAQTTSALRTLMARSEAYPELRSNQNFMQLQGALNEIEEQLSAARRAYNSSVGDYNNGCEMIPYNFVAGVMGYKRKPVLVTADAEKANHDVTALFNRKTG